MRVEIVVCDLTGLPLGAVETSEYSFVSRLNDAGDGSFSFQPTSELYDNLAPWSGMIVVLGGKGDVLWSGVPTKRRGTVQSGTVEVVASEWIHWLTRVAPGIYDDANFYYADYDEVRAGFIVNDLIDLIPQDQPGFIPVPLLPPAVDEGPIATLGEPLDTAERDDVWAVLQPLRDQGIEFWVKTSLEDGRYIPRVIVGNPLLDSNDQISLWYGSDVSSLDIVEDGSKMATRWRLQGVGEAVEKFASGTGMVLLDATKDYGDEFSLFTNPADDEEVELGLRADKLLAQSKQPSNWFQNVNVRPDSIVDPGDRVLLATPKLDSSSISGTVDVQGRVESVDRSLDRVTINLVEPEVDTDPLPPSVDYMSQQRRLDEGRRSLELRASTDRSRAKWTGSYGTVAATSGLTKGSSSRYRHNDMVRDGDWLMIANKPTSDRPAPQPEGDPFYGYDGTLTNTSTIASQVTVGQRYEFIVGAWLLGWRLWTTAGEHYVAYTVTDPEGARVKSLVGDYTATDTGWYEFAIDVLLISPGTKFDLLVVISETAPVETSWSGDWNYTTPNNPGEPVAGAINHSGKSKSLLQVSKTDYNSIYRGEDLLGLDVGDKIDSATITWTVQEVTDSGTYVDIAVEPQTQATPGVQGFTAHNVQPASLHYGKDADYWPTSPFPQVRGLFVADGTLDDTVLDDHAYGVDIKVQSAAVSPDWDLMALTGGSSGGEFPDTGWQDFELINGFTAYGNPDWYAHRYRRIGGIVYLNIMIGCGSSTEDTCGALPAGFRPSINTGYAAIKDGGTACHTEVISADGRISIKGRSSSWVMFNTSFPAEQ